MALARDQDDIRGHRTRHGVSDGQCPIRLHLYRLTLRQTQQNLGNDGLGFLATGVVAGYHDLIGILGGDGPHKRSLGGIAITPATKDAPQPPATLCRQRPQRGERLGQRIGAVGIVHRHYWLPFIAHAFHATWHRMQTAARLNGRFQRDPQVPHRCQNTQKIGNVVGTNHPGAQELRSMALHDLKLQAIRCIRDVAGLQARGLLSRYSPDIQLSRIHFRSQLGSAWVVHINDGAGQTRPGK